MIITSPELVDKFVDYWMENLSDVSDCPDIPPKKIRFWMYKGSVYKPQKKKRYPSPHAVLKGMRGKGTNDAIDFVISLNKWCATFKDQDGVTVDLVTRYIVYAWLHYCNDMVRTLCVESLPLYVISNCALRHFFTLYVSVSCPLREYVLSST